MAGLTDAERLRQISNRIARGRSYIQDAEALDEIAGRLAAGEADTARLDWLQGQMTHGSSMGGWMIHSWPAISVHQSHRPFGEDTVREALDAAMKEK